MDLLNPPAEDPNARRQGDLADRSFKAYACFEHSHTTPERDVLFPTIQVFCPVVLPREHASVYGAQDTA